jgi:rsbT co-antagonist protein RsbR
MEAAATESTSALLREVASTLRDGRTELLAEWARRIMESRLLTAMTREEILAEATTVYDNYVEALEPDSIALQTYASDLTERTIARGAETQEVLGMVLLLRDILARALFKKYQLDLDVFNRVLDAYEPAANRFANMVAAAFVHDRERIIRQQQVAIRDLSTPVLQVRERLLLLPVIGPIDPHRAGQLTEQLLRSIRETRSKVAVLDLAAVPAIESAIAMRLVETVEAARLLGAAVIMTGLSPAIAQTLVAIGADVSQMLTVGDLQEGIERAERELGSTAAPVEERPSRARTAWPFRFSNRVIT